MANRWIEKTRFAVLDQQGRRHQVVVRVEMLDAGTLAGAAWTEGMQQYRLATGEVVTAAADGTLCVAATGAVLHRV